MPDPKGDKLYVNLGASQARRRLKGFGHGVRKVQSAGRNQAVIIHTATGQHLVELQRKFADVGFSMAESKLHEPIGNLPNLGPASAAWLRNAGIATISELERLGPGLAYQLVKQQQRKASLNLLWSLAAGLQNRDWRELSEDEKARLQLGARLALPAIMVENCHEGRSMNDYGQLVHVEEFHIEGVHYRVAVFRVEGGLHGEWSCSRCALGEKNGVHPTVEEAVTETKKFIDDHHHLKHR
jgi:DNA transformation protein and related proteins